MVWSLSKDDDGLDSVLPLADASARTSPLQVAAGARPPASDAAPLGTSSTVVVDPTSQMPEAFGARAPRGAVEPTVVLKGRKLDQLRAEVARHRTAHLRKKQRFLLLWAGAGGLALCLGWAVGAAFRPDESAAEQAPDALNPVEAAEDASAQTQPSSPAVGSEAVAPRAAKPSAPTEQAASSADAAELPGDDEAATSAGNSKDETDAFTLDDLPLD